MKLIIWCFLFLKCELKVSRNQLVLSINHCYLPLIAVNCKTEDMTNKILSFLLVSLLNSYIYVIINTTRNSLHCYKLQHMMFYPLKSIVAIQLKLYFDLKLKNLESHIFTKYLMSTTYNGWKPIYKVSINTRKYEVQYVQNSQNKGK